MRTSALLLLLLGLAPAAESQTPIVDFSSSPVGELPAGWKLRGTSGHASRMTVQQAEDGSRHALLEYDFGQEANPGGWIDRAGRKTCIMGCWLPIPADHWILEVDIEGDGSGHGLVLSVGETGGAEWFNYDLGRLDFKGRKTLTADLRTDWRDSAGPNANRLVEPPLSLASLNLEQEPGGPAQGHVKLHGVSAVSGEPWGLAALSVAWLLPDGAAFVAGEDTAPHVRLQNISRREIAGKLSWRVRCQGETVAEGGAPFAVPAQEQTVERLSLGGVPVGFYDAELHIESADQARTVRSAFAVVPAPKADPRLRIGAGESYPWFTGSDEFVGYTARLAQMGASWTLAFVPFTAFDGPEHYDEAAKLCDILDRASQNDIALVCMLGNLPADLVDQNTNRAVTDLETLVARHERATAMAAEALVGRVRGWGILHLDRSFFPETAQDALPTPNYADFVTRSHAALAGIDPRAVFMAGMVDRSYLQWSERKNLAWPDGVGFITETLAYADPERIGSVREYAAGAAQHQADYGLGSDLWLKGWYASIPVQSWEPGRQFAEGVARWVVEAVHGAPQAHVLYTFQPEHPERGALLDHSGNVNVAGVAFATCADLLHGAEPAGEFQGERCRGYLFTCEQGTLAALWPDPVDGTPTVKLKAGGAIEHYGACRRYADIPAGTQELPLKPGINLLRGPFTLLAP
jgi:hypothetical protein